MPHSRGVVAYAKKASRRMRHTLCTPEVTYLYRIPVTQWIQKYRREYIVPDTAAGITMAIYNVPQGMAYSVLASLSPVYGLYASFFPPLLYFLFGTSRHISIGVFSITCLMVGQTRQSILPDYANGTHATEYKGMTGLSPPDVVIVLAFVTGMVQIIMWALHLSFLSAYLSDSVVSGLTFAAALHALIAQVPGILGVKLDHPDTDNFLHIITKIKDIFVAVPRTNLVTLLLSVCTIVFLLIFKKLVEPTFRRWRIPLPSELIAVRFAVLRLPAPKLPRFELVPDLINHGASIAIVAYVVTLSMGKLFARKHKYQINNDQEMLALGIVGVVSSFFSVFPTSTSLSRSLVNEASGARTQVLLHILLNSFIYHKLIVCPLCSL
ncbi:inorganic anion transporter, SulP family [Oesophagostomum dentatum]|uniref:Inorganic anion transporter, SulP family n=1 Tax=Oesophagostomum dentatum TaxID=61180 RepID=A0A0B1TQP8_OESDE|nr:inorganic anion transporter, SulP family [Oesophagostomum dentatum]